MQLVDWLVKSIPKHNVRDRHRQLVDCLVEAVTKLR